MNWLFKILGGRFASHILHTSNNKWNTSELQVLEKTREQSNLSPWSMVKVGLLWMHTTSSNPELEIIAMLDVKRDQANLFKAYYWRDCAIDFGMV
jgi:hypothetical protein